MLRHKIKRNSGVTKVNQLQFWQDALSIFGGEKRGILPRFAQRRIKWPKSVAIRQPTMTALKKYVGKTELPLLKALVRARQEV